jgi:hypothetical protein
MEHSSDHIGRQPSFPAPSKDKSVSEVPGLTQASLVACVYIAVQCSDCGDVRQARPEFPVAETVVCPECGMSCSYAPLARGLTSRKLPFSEIRRSQAQLLYRRDEIPELGFCIRGPSG